MPQVTAMPKIELPNVDDLWDRHSELAEIIECDMRSDESVMKKREFYKAVEPILSELSELRKASE
jgi:hypothetical protein